MRTWIAWLGVACIGCAGAQGGDDAAGMTNGIPTSSDDSASSTAGGSGTMSTTTGASTSTSTTTGTDETGIPPGCGDGVPEAPEECDDGNDVDGDGCNRDCRPSGQLIWSHISAAGFGENEEAFDVGVTPGGEYYAVGYVRNAALLTDHWIRKFSSIGGVVSTHTYDGPNASNDQIRGMTVDGASGDYYVIGYENVAMQSNDIVIQRRMPDGTIAWQDSYNGPNSGSDVGWDVALTPDGDVVATGHHITVSEAHDVWLRKYSPDGMVRWTRSYTGPSAGTDVGRSLAVAPNGDIYVAGYETRAGEAANQWLGKFDADGNLSWDRSINGPDNLDDFFMGVATDAAGNAYACGYQSAAAFPWRSFVRRYDPNGGVVWTEIYEGQATMGVHCFGIAVDNAGRVVWVGGEIDAAGIRHIVVRKLDADGVHLWTNVIPSEGPGPDFGREVTIAADDEIYVGGAIGRDVDARDVWVGRLTP